jgi:hypothetical protein
MLLVGMLVAAGYALFLIWKIEAVYSEVWGADVSLAAWSRKRWAFVLMVAAQALAVLSVLIPIRSQWIGIIYLGLIFLSLGGFVSSYRVLLEDLKRLPRKK